MKSTFIIIMIIYLQLILYVLHNSQTSKLFGCHQFVDTQQLKLELSLITLTQQLPSNNASNRRRLPEQKNTTPFYNLQLFYHHKTLR
jgi:hypothetical protein